MGGGGAKCVYKGHWQSLKINYYECFVYFINFGILFCTMNSILGSHLA